MRLMKYARASRSAEIAAEAVRALGRKGDLDAMEFLGGKWGVGHRKQAVAVAACESLTKIGDVKALPSLFMVVSGPRPAVVVAALSAMVKLDAKAKGLPELASFLADHESADVRRAVVALSVEVGGQAMVQAMTARVRRDREEDIRARACLVLGTFRAKSAVPALMSAMEKDQSPRVRAAAHSALAKIAAPPPAK